MIKQAIVPAAGFGTRMFPFTKTVPKEMLPVADKPAIHYAVEELVKSGIYDVTLVTRRGKSPMDEYFNPSEEVEEFLQERGLTEELQRLHEIVNLGRYIRMHRQSYPRGPVDAINECAHFMTSDPFLVSLPDDVCIYESETPVNRLKRAFEEYNKHLVGVERFDGVSERGISFIEAEPIGDGMFEIKDIVRGRVPASGFRLTTVGRYLFKPSFFTASQRLLAESQDEVRINDIIRRFLDTGEKVLAAEIGGRRYDVGNSVDFTIANIEAGLANGSTKDPMLKYLEGERLRDMLERAKGANGGR